jgi:membrane-anchored protein YejM (alkaline phosphatase superfamily)
MIIERVTFLNLPISAPTEKGIIYISILEELGIFGFILFIMLIFILFYKAIIYNMSSIIVFIVILLSNIGEATFFSIGGLGLLNLIFLTLIITRPKL